MTEKHLIKTLEKEVEKIECSFRAVVISKIANKYYKSAPKSDEELLEFCEQLIASKNMDLFSIATLWIKKRKTILDKKNFFIVENWLNKYIDDWGTCDQFCYRVLNPFVDKYPELYSYVSTWIKSEKTYVKRAAPVSLIRSGKGIRVKTDFDKIVTIVDGLKNDSHSHIQKAIGWLLKYSYQAYPEKVLNYLRENVKTLSRTAFRYALEKVPEEIRKEMMSL